MTLSPYNLQVGDPTLENQLFQADNISGENIKVAVRVRPMLVHEYRRGDSYCVKIIDPNNLQINKGFNKVIDESKNQADVFHECSIPKILNSALDGYSATIFCYGQTGSGKTYTIAGNEDKLGRDAYISDSSEGLIPRSVRWLWQQMAQREETFFVKASFLEIYNEQLNDLLNNNTGNLHCRWNPTNGFFVEDLMVLECTNVDDMTAILHEGMKHRKIGSHDLNKDSSRSHSILTIYLITELQSNGQMLRKYGKISFVDLAGSERLKESNSKGTMIKETQQINKSLFTLGKVISTLADKRKKGAYIPYRDSKLTMLLMDSLGGKAKTLMISCISPSAVYYDETMNTLNYATRTMNIKNKPVIQMDEKERIIYNLTKENDLLRMENQFLREQLERAAQGLSIEIPDFLNRGKIQLPPLSHSRKQSSSSKRLISGKNKNNVNVSYNKVINEYEFQIKQLKNENEEIMNAREVAEKNYQILMNDNHALNVKLENLENVFIGNPIQKGVKQQNGSSGLLSNEYMTSNLLAENTELKRQVNSLEEKNVQLSIALKEKEDSLKAITSNIGNSVNQINELMRMKQSNGELQKRVEYLQKRERDLLDTLVKNKNYDDEEEED